MGPNVLSYAWGADVAAYLSQHTPGGPADECWVWQGTWLQRDQYGRAWVKGKHYLAHRLAWAVANQRALSPDMVIMHQCDNPPCVNPAHLRLGSPQENMTDKAQKGRAWRGCGELSAQATLTNAQVMGIRMLRVLGLRPSRLAALLGIRPELATRVCGARWRHLPSGEELCAALLGEDWVTLRRWETWCPNTRQIKVNLNHRLNQGVNSACPTKQK